MKRAIKSIVALILSLTMVFTLLPEINKNMVKSVYADGISNTGKCGVDAVWSYDKATGELSISGSGTVTDNSFSNLPIRTVIIENGITGIGDEVFRGSQYLENIYLPESMNNIGEFTFEKCQKLKTFNVDAQNKDYTSVDGVLYSRDMKMLLVYPAEREGIAFTIPDGVEILGDYAFDYTKKLEKLTIPKTLKNTGKYAPFYDAKSIKEFIVDADNEDFLSKNGDLYDKNITKLIKHAIGSSTTSISIGDGVTSIGENSFAYSNVLEEVVLKESVNQIDYEAFGNCTNLTKITILNPECELNDILHGIHVNKDITIFGYKDSTAESYAANKKIPFVSLDEKKIVSVEIASMPKKTVFALGDNYNSTGLTIRVNFEDGTSVIRSTGFDIQGFDSDTLGKKKINVLFKGFSVAYEVEIVKELAIPVAGLDEKTSVDIIEANQLYYLRFTPDISGIYDFYALSDSDTYGAVYDADGNLLAENDDKGDTDSGEYVVDFYISYNMEAGKTYLLAAKFQAEDELGSFDIVVKSVKKEEETTTSKPTTPESTTSKPTTPESTTSKPEATTTQKSDTKPSETATPEVTTQKPTKGPATTKKPTTTKITVKKTAVKKLSKKRASTKAKITLKKITGVTGYQIKISSVSSFKKSKTVTKNFKKNVFTFKSSKMKNKKILYVKARAYKKVNGKFYYSSWSAKKKVKIKK